MKKSWCLFLILISFQTSAADQSDDASCRYRNLLEDNWLRLRNQVRETKRYIDMPAYDQAGTGTCYAFAATQMVDYWRQSRGFMPDEHLELASPIYMALIYKISEGEAGYFSGGNPSAAISALKKYGLCSKEVVNADLKEFLGKEIGIFKSTGKATGVQLENDLVFTELTSPIIYKKVPGGGETSTWTNFKFNDYFAWSKSHEQPLYIRKMDKATLKKVYDALMPYLAKRNYVGFLREILKSCEEKKNQIKYLDQMPNPRTFEVDYLEKAMASQKVKSEEEYYQWRANQFSDMIRTLLNKKNSPAIGIGYCPHLMPKKGKAGPEGQKSLKNRCERGDHASILVGKREENGKCQYFLKNTWNKPGLCKAWGTCVYREVQDHKTNRSYQEEMGAWVNEEDILNNITSLYYIYPETEDEKEIEAHWNRIEEKYIQSTDMFIKSLEKTRKKNQ